MMQNRTSIGYLLLILTAVASPAHAEPEGKTWEVFDGAEQRFQPPSTAWFNETQQALREEAARVSDKLDIQGEEYANAWKAHLHWDLLERNLGEISSVNVTELREVRRWFYSNRKGLETAYFADLRRCMDEYLDAAVTFSYDDLHATFYEKVSQARELCQKLAEEPSDVNAAALGRLLGWLETTRQLPEETAAVRKAMSLPNAQVVIANSLIGRILATQMPEVTESVPVTGQETIPPSGLRRRPRKVTIRGHAKTSGKVSLEIAPNDEQVELNLIYQGMVDSRCRAITGPVILHLHTFGTASAVKPIFFNPTGLSLGTTVVTPKITNKLEKVTSDNPLFRRLAERQANRPESKAYKNMRAKTRTVELLKSELDKRIAAFLAEIKGEFDGKQGSVSQFSEVTAPLVREGATPYFHSTSSTSNEIVLNGFSGRREQFGASFPCPTQLAESDFQAQVHVSFINNMAETILGGKTITDTFFMRYAKVLHAELPMPLMVHTRSRRWTVTMAKHRPLELVIPAKNQFRFIFRATGVEIEGVRYPGEITATFTYSMAENGFGEIELEREGDVELDTSLAAEPRMFLQGKIAAFFAPAFKGGGVVIPDGGVLGALSGIQSEGIMAENEWIVISATVPQTVLDDVIRFREQSTSANASE